MNLPEPTLPMGCYCDAEGNYRDCIGGLLVSKACPSSHRLIAIANHLAWRKGEKSTTVNDIGEASGYYPTQEVKSVKPKLTWVR